LTRTTRRANTSDQGKADHDIPALPDQASFNEIHLINHTVVHWLHADEGCEIAVYRTSSGGGMLRSVTGERISAGGPGIQRGAWHADVDVDHLYKAAE
jgi:hypothetical protein